MNIPVPPPPLTSSVSEIILISADYILNPSPQMHIFTLVLKSRIGHVDTVTVCLGIHLKGT